MYLRLILLLSILNISAVTLSQNVMTPLDGDYIYDPSAPPGSLTNPNPVAGVIQKWVHDPSQRPGTIGWDQSEFKSYRLNNISFRLRFPNDYDPAKKYPMIVF